jgi:hypothetical protein
MTSYWGQYLVSNTFVSIYIVSIPGNMYSAHERPCCHDGTVAMAGTGCCTRRAETMNACAKQAASHATGSEGTGLVLGTGIIGGGGCLGKTCMASYWNFMLLVLCMHVLTIMLYGGEDVHSGSSKVLSDCRHCCNQVKRLLLLSSTALRAG